MTESGRSKHRGLIGEIVGRAAPVVVRNIDMDAVIAELDVNSIAAQLDIDAIVERLDVDVIAARLDLNALISRLDVNAVAAELDLDALVARLDVDAVAERIDVDAVVERVDVARIAAGTTADVAVSGLDLVRRQLVRADRTVEGVIDRILRRPADARPAAPTELADPATTEPTIVGDTADEPTTSGRRAVSGHYAGPVTRLLAVAGDVVGAFATWGVLASTVSWLLRTFLDFEPGGDAIRWASAALLASWLLLWFWPPVALFGRTAAMAVVGLGVVTRDGGLAGSGRALVRALVLPFSIILLGLGFIGAFVGRERRTLHDVAAGTALVYDWGDREAEQPTSIRDLLSARVRRRAARS